MGFSKNLAIERGEFNGDYLSCGHEVPLDDFLCQIQVEELPFRRGFSSQSESNKDVELIPF